MDVVAAKAGHAPAVHYALYEIISLHAVFVRRAVGIVGERGPSQGMLFKLPKVSQVSANLVPHRPVIIFAVDGIRQRASLRMALDAGIASWNVIHSGRIKNISSRGMLHMLASGAVTLFASNIPLGRLLGADVVADGVASIAGRARRPLHIVGRIKRLPPVRSFSH